MAVEAQVRLVQDWIAQVWNGGDLERLHHFHPSTFDNHGRPASIDEVRQWHLRQRATYPDIHYTVDDIVAAGEKVAVRWTATATHAGALWDLIPATGKTIVWRGMHLLRVVDRRIVEVWAIADTIAQLQQMGVTLQPAPTDAGDEARPE